ncbi:MAG: hypothetical protein ABSE90_06935 [Verrucomicrobiota bacterium]|jgi:hypothetical protein
MLAAKGRKRHKEKLLAETFNIEHSTPNIKGQVAMKFNVGCFRWKAKRASRCWPPVT